MNETNRTVVRRDEEAESPAERNWQIVKTALLDRITRRRNALARLAPASIDSDNLQADIARAGDNATALLELMDTTERAIDRVFAARSRRIAAMPPSAPKPTAPDVDAFKAN